MPHYTKSFAAYARDFGIQEQTGIPEVLGIAVPTIIVDDKSEYVAPRYPIYGGGGTMAGTAAVYGIIGLFVPSGTNPIRLRGMSAKLQTTAWLDVRLGIADLRTANQSAVVPIGIDRGGPGVTASILVGTTTVAPTVWPEVFQQRGATDSFYTAQSSIARPGLVNIVLQPGEYIWIQSSAVNVAQTSYFLFEECLYPAGPVTTPVG